MVYVEIFGKKYKTEVEAYNENHAQEMVQGKMKFYKVEEIPEDDFSKNVNDLKELKKMIDAVVDVVEHFQNPKKSKLPHSNIPYPEKVNRI